MFSENNVMISCMFCNVQKEIQLVEIVVRLLTVTSS